MVDLGHFKYLRKQWDSKMTHNVASHVELCLTLVRQTIEVCPKLGQLPYFVKAQQSEKKVAWM